MRRKPGIALFVTGVVLVMLTLGSSVVLRNHSARVSINDLKRLRAGDTASLGGIVTLADAKARIIYFQDHTGGLRVEIAQDKPFPSVGDSVRVRTVLVDSAEAGEMQVGRSRVQLSNIDVSVTGREPLPQAQPMSLAEQFSNGGLGEARLLQTSGVVRAASIRDGRLALELAEKGMRMPLTVLHPRDANTESLIDARVSVRGVLQLDYQGADLTSVGAHLWVADGNDIQVLEPAPAEIARAPSVWSLISDRTWADRGSRVRVRGTIRAGATTNAVLIENGGVFMPVETTSAERFKPGDVVEAIGWPNQSRFSTILQRAQVVALADAIVPPTAELPNEPITDLLQVRELNRDQANQSQPVDLVGVVTANQAPYQLFFFQSGKEGIFIDALDQSISHLTPGTKIRIRGFTAAGDFAPVIKHPRIDVLGPAQLPVPQILDAADAATGTYDSEWVEVEGLMRPFGLIGGNPTFKLIAPFGTINGALINPGDTEALERFVDAKVRVRGVFATVFTKEGTLVGYRMFTQSPEYFEILREAPASSASAQAQPISDLLRFSAKSEGSHRARVRGVVTRHSPRRIYVQDASGSVIVHASHAGIDVGDLVDAIGYPTPSDNGSVLSDATVTLVSHDQKLEPAPANAEEILSGSFDSELVQIEAKLLSHIPGAAQQTLVLQNGYTSFNAVLEGSTPLLDLREGGVLRVVGVCAVQRQLFTREDSALPVSFRVLLRSPEDVQVLIPAPWWNARQALPALGLLTLSIFLAMLWVAALRRRVNVQTAEIQSQRSFLRQVLDMCPTFIFVKDEQGRFSLVNRAFAQARGCAPEDMIGKNDFEIGIESEQAEAYQRDDSEVLREGREKTVIEPHTDVQGRQLWLQTVKRRLTDEHGNAQVVGVANDITLHKHAEETLRKAREAAENANRAKSEFLANMSHEIRTPLNGILGMTALWMDTEMSREQREYLETVKLSADGLLTVVNEVLDFSKIEAGKLEIDSAEFDLLEVLESVAKTLAVRAHEKGLELVCDMAADVPQIIRGDANRVRQVLLNLAGNAIKFTGSGEVVLSVALQSREGGTNTLLFGVRDTGIGIDPGRHRSIFDPFVQADSSTTRNYGGTGLGLTISSRLVTMMGGRMWVDSTAGQGSTFWFTLQSECVRRKLQHDPAIALHDARVLIVDDNASVRGALANTLKRWKVRCISAANAQEAALCLETSDTAGEPYQAVVVDLSMPDDEVKACIRDTQRRHDLRQRIIAVSRSTAQRDDEARCQPLGVQTFIVKPVRSAELQKALIRMIQDSQAATLAPVRKSAPEPTAGLDILLAEDNAVNQMLMVRLLQKRGHRVTVAGTGRIALELMEKHRFDLVLMDVQMPELDGLAAAEEIRRREQLTERHTPIIALTAHAMSGDKERCLSAGMDAYLTKPINIKELEEAVKVFGIRTESENTGT